MNGTSAVARSRIQPQRQDRAEQETATTMLACEMATVAWARDLQQPGVELQADQEHVQDDADLRDDAQRRRRRLAAAG